MTNAQLTPRQRMINMIYLVLTAILAMNVSAEVLDAFKSVNEGIGVSNTSLQSKNSNVFTDFSAQFANDSVRADKAYKRAIKAKELSNKLYVLLEKYKEQMIAEAGGIDPVTGKIKRDDDINVPTRMFVEDNGVRGKELRAQIETGRRELLSLLDEQERKDAEQDFALKSETEKPGVTWEFAKFNHIPAVAAVTLLSKYQNDLLSAEGYVVDKLYSSVYKHIDKVDRFSAKVIPISNYVLQGENYKAEVLVAAYNSTQDPEVFLGQFTPQVKKNSNQDFEMLGSDKEDLPLINPVKVDVSGGMGKLSMGSGATGNKKYSGVVRIKTTEGKYKFFPFEGEYQVAQKTAVVSPLKMNVLYIGLDNPVSISVPGVAQSDVIAAFEGDGQLVKNEDGTFKALVGKQGNTKVKISAKINGHVMPMGEQEFRIKRVPDPATTVDGVWHGGPMGGQPLNNVRGIVPISEVVYGQIPWEVLSFTVSVRKGNDLFKNENTGPLLSTKSKGLMKGLKKGDAVFIDEIIVRGPGGDKRKIAPIAFLITTE